MKKILTLMLSVAVIAVAMTACAPKENETPDTNDNVVTDTNENLGETPDTDVDADVDADADVETDDVVDEITPDADVDVDTDVQTPVENETPVEPEKPVESETPSEGDAPEAGAGIDGLNTVEIMDKIYETNPVELMLMPNTFELSDVENITYHTGLSSVDKVKEVSISMPMIGAIPYTLAVVKANSAEDAAVVAQEMKDNVNTRKWVCVEADDLQVASYGDVVVLFMVGSEEYSDLVTSEDIISAFKTVCGGEISLY